MGNRVGTRSDSYTRLEATSRFLGLSPRLRDRIVDHAMAKEEWRWLYQRPYITAYYDLPDRSLTESGQSLCLTLRRDVEHRFGALIQKRILSTIGQVCVRREFGRRVAVTNVPTSIQMGDCRGATAGRASLLAQCQQDRIKLYRRFQPIEVIMSVDTASWTTDTRSYPEECLVSFDVNLEVAGDSHLPRRWISDCVGHLTAISKEFESSFAAQPAVGPKLLDVFAASFKP